MHDQIVKWVRGSALELGKVLVKLSDDDCFEVSLRSESSSSAKSSDDMVGNVFSFREEQTINSMHLNEPAQSLKRTARRALSVPADPFPEEAWDEVQADPKKASDKHKDAYGM